MSDGEPSLDIGFLVPDVEYVVDESGGQSRRVRVVDHSLRPSRANVAAFWAKVVK
ncbi:hypothetical protein [Rhodococcus coprophilus]|uniref:Uncharacterized protein n=1 Tax=Rhodococcus coprophilus TaxID=38310 RepID=A0A2X4TM01_9NOCA|nr:hypothetical protein [Rhodococcus coprophilus]MBM7460770.1 hypothetical protein [Rhodococcus coprophilus]SQI28577.1 Uncharacterised protein [Rhodococcus coprophilus]